MSRLLSTALKCKFEARNSKHETSTKFPNSNDENRRCLTFLSFPISCFEFVSCFVLRISCFLLVVTPAIAQSLAPLDGRDGRNLLLENFRPKPTLKVEQHVLMRAKFPVVDVHTHFRHKFHGSTDELEAWIKLMD